MPFQLPTGGWICALCCGRKTHDDYRHERQERSLSRRQSERRNDRSTIAHTAETRGRTRLQSTRSGVDVTYEDGRAPITSAEEPPEADMLASPVHPPRECGFCKYIALRVSVESEHGGADKQTALSNSVEEDEEEEDDTDVLPYSAVPRQRKLRWVTQEEVASVDHVERADKEWTGPWLVSTHCWL